jgi:hypothetical protein
MGGGGMGGGGACGGRLGSGSLLVASQSIDEHSEGRSHLHMLIEKGAARACLRSALQRCACCEGVGTATHQPLELQHPQPTTKRLHCLEHTAQCREFHTTQALVLATATATVATAATVAATTAAAATACDIATDALTTALTAATATLSASSAACA